MRTKEKAEDLIRRFKPYVNCISKRSDNSISGYTYIEDVQLENAKKCALLCVNEIINANPHSNPLNTKVGSTMHYWVNVKEEIEKL